MQPNKTTLIAPTVLSAILLALMAGMGYTVQQSDFGRLMWLSIPFFLLYCLINFGVKGRQKVTLYIGTAIALRLLLMGSFPLLSDDVYRFIWDGHVSRAGLNPFAFTPAELLEQDIPGLTQELFLQLNSPHYHTVYPPIAQFCYWVAVSVFPESWTGAAFVLKLFILLSEIGSIWLIIKLLAHFRLPTKNVLLYALNPLVILELTGNLHFEAVMIFLLLLSIWLLVRQQWLSAALSMAGAISTKLLPLLFLPFLIKRLGWKKSAFFFVVVGLGVGLLFAPLLSDFFFSNFGESLGLYFQKFEFNGSIYYLLRSIGEAWLGYNAIAAIGPALGTLTFLSIIWLAYYERNATWASLPKMMLFAISIYLLFSTTVHPWYLSLPLVFAVFTRFRYPVLWSGLVWFTYINYSYPEYHENLYMVAFEYGVVLLYAAWEIFICCARRDVSYSPSSNSTNNKLSAT